MDEGELARRVEELRARCSPPVGTWTTSAGTFESVMAEDWVLRRDGTGARVIRGPFGWPRERITFDWRPATEATFELRERAIAEFVGEDFAEPEPVEDEPMWETVAFRFGVNRTDLGQEPALFLEGPALGVALTLREVRSRGRARE